MQNLAKYSDYSAKTIFVVQIALFEKTIAPSYT